jgi:hypothetical protein
MTSSFVTSTEQVTEGIAKSRATWIQSSVHATVSMKGKCSHSSSVSCQPSFGKVEGIEGTVNSMLYASPDEETKWREVRRTTWPSYSAAPANPFLWKLSI